MYQLTPANLAPYVALTYPTLLPGSAALQALRGQLLGISAMADGVVVGLVLAERASASAAKVISMMVVPAWRQRGIGTRLLGHLMTFAAEEGIAVLSIRYQAPLTQTVPLDRMLMRLGWPAPQQQFLLLEGQANHCAALPWPERCPLPAGYTLVSWHPSYRPALAQLGAPPELQAAIHSTSIEPTISMVLQSRESLVGWLIVDRTGPAAVRYSSLFVAQGHRGRGQALHLLVEGFRRQASAGIQLGRAAVAPQSQAMLRLVHRHLGAQLSQVTVARGSRLQLHSPGTSPA
jgi:GNAT superfamily N-acetyltransferase